MSRTRLSRERFLAMQDWIDSGGFSTPSLTFRAADGMVWVERGIRSKIPTGLPSPSYKLEYELPGPFSKRELAILEQLCQRKYLFGHRSPEEDGSYAKLKSVGWPGRPIRSVPTSYVSRCIRQLREKIEDDPSKPEIILSIPGYGYDIPRCNFMPHEMNSSPSFTDLLMQVWVQRERPGQNVQQRRKSIVPTESSEFVIDLPSKSVWVDGDKLPQLSSDELRALEYLLEHRGQTVTTGGIATAVWPERPNPDQGIPEIEFDSRMLIGNLRRKIERDPRRPDIILSAGYLCYSIPGHSEPQRTQMEPKAERQMEGPAEHQVEPEAELQIEPEAQRNSRRIPPPSKSGQERLVTLLQGAFIGLLAGSLIGSLLHLLGGSGFFWTLTLFTICGAYYGYNRD